MEIKNLHLIGTSNNTNILDKFLKNYKHTTIILYKKY